MSLFDARANHDLSRSLRDQRQLGGNNSSARITINMECWKCRHERGGRFLDEQEGVVSGGTVACSRWVSTNDPHWVGFRGQR
jgi:hypothetical protein